MPTKDLRQRGTKQEIMLTVWTVYAFLSATPQNLLISLPVTSNWSRRHRFAPTAAIWRNQSVTMFPSGLWCRLDSYLPAMWRNVLSPIQDSVFSPEDGDRMFPQSRRTASSSSPSWESHVSGINVFILSELVSIRNLSRHKPLLLVECWYPD